MDPEELKKSVDSAMEEALKARLPEFVKAVSEASKENEKQVQENGKKATNKSVIRDKSAGELAWRAPFVEVGEEVKEFLTAVKERSNGIVERTANANISNDEDGGIIVPEEVDMAIFAYQRQVSILRSNGASVFTTRGNSRRMNKLDQSVNSFGGITFQWVGESEAGTATGTKIGKMLLSVKKLMALTTQSNEFLQDADANAANFLIGLFAEAASYTEDMAFFQGSGLDRPQGVLNYPGLKTVNRSGSGNISLADITKMYYSIPPELRGFARWFSNTAAVQAMDLLVDGNNRPLLQDPYMNPQSSTPLRSLKGLPLIELSEAYLPALGSKGDLMLLVPSHYYILDKTGLRIDVSPHSKFETDEMEWRFVKRTDGKLAGNKSAVVLDIP